MGGGEQLQELILALLGGRRQLAGTVHRKRIPLGLVSSLKFTVVDPHPQTASARRLLIEVPEERPLLGRVVQPLRLCLLVQMRHFLDIGGEVEAQGGRPS
jgi:hypothetical protein